MLGIGGLWGSGPFVQGIPHPKSFTILGVSLGVCPCPTWAGGGGKPGGMVWRWLGAGDGSGRGWWGFAGRGVSAAPHHGAGGKLGGGSRWWQVDFNTGVGPVPSGVCTAPSESRPLCWGGSGCLGVRGCSGCPGGLGPWAKAAHSPASKGCRWLSPGAPLPPRSRLCSPTLLPTSPGVQPPHPRLHSMPPPGSLGAPPRARALGHVLSCGRSFPSPAGVWENRGGLVGAVSPRGWGTGLGTPLVSPWGPCLCWRDRVGELAGQMLADSLGFGIRHRPLWGWHRVYRGAGTGAEG